MPKKWILFDGDNTLWNTEILYDNARKEFCKYVLHIIEEAGENRHRYIDNDTIDRW
jgi:beta-phosphoglucomutase-like phosphatase (HAD superfamily)